MPGPLCNFQSNNLDNRMEVSEPIRPSIQPSLTSPNGVYIATLTNRRLEIRATSGLRLLRSIPLVKPSESLSSRDNIQLRWSPSSVRVLICAETTTRVWDLRDSTWKAVIDNGSGSMGKIVHAEFAGWESYPGTATHSDDEVLLFSDFAARLTIWSLSSGRSVEIKEPKFSNSRSYGYRPSSLNVSPKKPKVLALLSRSGSQDMLTLHAPNTYSVLSTVQLQTSDAQGLRWSHDGNWIAIWDTPSLGAKVHIHTASGQLYRSYTGPAEGDDNSGLPGVGIRSVEWSPKNDYLALGGHDGRVTLLGTRTFAPLVYLDHTGVINLPNTPIWTERLVPIPSTSLGPSQYNREFEPADQPVTPPSIATGSSATTTATSTSSASNGSSPPSRAITALLFSPSGQYLATQTASHATTLWLWNLIELKPSTVILQHGRIRSLGWHPRLDILAWTSGADASVSSDISSNGSRGSKEGTVYLHTPSQLSSSLSTAISTPASSISTEARPPQAFSLPVSSNPNKPSLTFHPSTANLSLLYADTTHSILLSPRGFSLHPLPPLPDSGLDATGTDEPNAELSNIQEEDEAEDSLMEALTGHSRRHYDEEVGSDDTPRAIGTITWNSGGLERDVAKKSLLEESGFGFVDDEDDDDGYAYDEDTFAGRRR